MSPLTIRCSHCLADNGVQIRMTRKSMPFTICICCGSRTFINNLTATRGLGIVPLLLDQALERRKNDAPFREWFDDAIKTAQSTLLAFMRGPDAAPTPEQQLTRPNAVPVEIHGEAL